jgi:hypothetical protein
MNKMNDKTKQTNVEETKNNKKKLFLIIGGLVLFIIILVIFGIFLYNSKNKQLQDDPVVYVELSDVDKVLDLTGENFNYKYQYASKLYLVNNKLYALLTGISNLKFDSNSIIVDNNKLYFVRDDVKDVLELVDSQTGYKNAVIKDKKGISYKMNLISSMGEPFETTKIK